MSTEEALNSALESLGATSELAQELPEEGDLPEGIPSAKRPGCLMSIIPVTTPGCATWLTAVFMLMTALGVWGWFLWDPDNVSWQHSIGWPRIAAVGALLIVIPWVVYHMLSLWMEGAPTPFPDLDYAWAEGMHALAVNGLSLQTLPVYLILGSRSESQERSLMDATGLRWRVAGVPEGPAPLHWYANSEAAFLFCSDCCWTSALASLRDDLAAEALAKGLRAGESPAGAFELGDNTFAAAPPAMVVSPMPLPAPKLEAPTSNRPAVRPPSEAIRGTIMLDQYQGSAAPPQPQRPIVEVPRGRSSNRGTLMFDEGSRRGESSGEVPAEPTAKPIQSAPAPMPRFSRSDEEKVLEPVLVSPQYSSASLQELQYLGQLIVRERQPVCPLNGVLSLIQFESIHSTPAELEELQKAIRSDLATVYYAFNMRAPVTALVVGLEKERGFRELVRRVGRDRATSQRFGRKFDVGAIPIESEVRALTAHVCGAFEDWAYALFREEHSLSHPGNTLLYELLSKVRCSWKERLSEILVGGFGCDATKSGSEDSVLFSGCYFAATGETPDRQAFVKGVVDKLGEEQELVEWSRNALRSHKRQRHLAAAGTVLALLLFILLLAMIVGRRFL